MAALSGGKFITWTIIQSQKRLIWLENSIEGKGSLCQYGVTCHIAGQIPEI